MNDDEVQKREFMLLMERSGLQQIKLARLLGVSPMTVNRWFSYRDDAVLPPYYAVNFLRAYMMLPEGARVSLPEKKIKK